MPDNKSNEPTHETVGAAMDEILAVIAKHDLAAVVVLAGPGRIMRHSAVTPTWGAARKDTEQTEDGVALHFHADLGKKEDRHRLKLTIGVLSGMAEKLRRASDGLVDVLDTLASQPPIQSWMAAERDLIERREGRPGSS